MDPKIDREWEELRTLLQLVALPVTGQVRLVRQDCCRLELLARALGNWQVALPAEIQARLTPHQAQILAQLERQLTRTCEESPSPLWTDSAMRQSHGVRRARRLAREALVSFGWLLAVPAGRLPHNLVAAQLI